MRLNLKTSRFRAAAARAEFGTAGQFVLLPRLGELVAPVERRLAALAEVAAGDEIALFEEVMDVGRVGRSGRGRVVNGGDELEAVVDEVEQALVDGLPFMRVALRCRLAGRGL